MYLPTLRYLVSAVFFIASVSGCGSGDFGSVNGKVTLDGKPLKGASVTFQPVKKGRPSSGITDEEGNYVLKYTADQEGAEIGEHIVRISLEETEKDEFGEEVSLGETVPAKFNVESELKREVKPGDNKFDFKLSTEGS